MDFVDDELEELHCFHPINPRNAVQNWDDVCEMSWECSMFSEKPFLFVDKHKADK